MSISIAVGAVISLALLTSSQNLLITWSKQSGSYSYNFVAVTLLVELVKFLVAGFMWLRSPSPQQQSFSSGSASHKNQPDDEETGENDPVGSPPAAAAPPPELSLAGLISRLPFALPALLYFVKNNLVFYGLRLLDPVHFQLLGNLKIATTALFFRVVMRKPMADLQWVALALLLIGTTTTQLKLNGGGPVNETGGAPPQHWSTNGVVIMLISATLSGAAAVATEHAMKSSARRRAESIHLQNLWSYAFGMLFNLLALLTSDAGQGSSGGAASSALFAGFTPVTLLIVLNNACSGLAVSAIMKFANNLVKLFTFAASLVLTTVLSALFFGFVPQLQFYLGAATVCIAIYLFRRK